MNIAESVNAYKIRYLEIIYKLNMNGKEKHSDKKIIAKIMKLDENN